MYIHKLLGDGAFWMVNKEMAKSVGIEAALLLADLIAKHGYFLVNNQLDEDGFFYNTAKDIESTTTLSFYKQKEALKALHEFGFVECKLKGMPARVHFKILEYKILNFFNTGVKEIQIQDFKNFETNNNKENNNKEKEKSSLSLFDKSDAVPSLPEDILKYLNEKKGGRGFDVTSKNNQTDIKARIKEKKYSLEDFKKVIDYKVTEWGKDAQARKWLRPETLFGKHFNGYLINAEEKGLLTSAGSNNFVDEAATSKDLL